MIEFVQVLLTLRNSLELRSFPGTHVTCICTVCMKSTILVEMIRLATKFTSENYNSIFLKVITFLLVFYVTRYN